MYRGIERPRRPAIPPSAYSLLAIIVMCRLVLESGDAWIGGTRGRIVLAAGTLMVVVAIGLRVMCRITMSTTLVVGVSILVGLCLASLSLVYAEDFVNAAQSTPVSSWRLKVVTEPTKREDVYRCKATVTTGSGAKGDVWLSSSEQYCVGSIVRCVGRFSPNSDDDWGRSSRMQGVWGRVRAVSVLDVTPPTGLQGMIIGLRARLLKTIDPEASEYRALLAGCVCGYKSGLTRFGLDKKFSACGISHLAAVSGSHLSIVVAVVGAVLKTCKTRPRMRVGVLLAASGAFVLFCGAPVSAVRSWIMTCAALLATVLGRRSHALSSVCVAGLLLVLLDPTASGQPGFVLSVLSVTGLCLFSPYATYLVSVLVGVHTPPKVFPKRLRRAIKGISDVLMNSISASMVALAATLPVVADTFGTVSLVGPVVNALVTVPFTALVGIGVLLCAFCEVPIVRTVLLTVCDMLSKAVLHVADACSSLPFASLDVSDYGQIIATFVLVGVTVLLIVWPRVSRKRILLPVVGAACIFACLFVRARYFAPARVCVLDVGQGDAILVQEGEAAVLIDTGPDASVADALARNNVLHIDAVILTHLHADHYAGLGSLSRELGCKKVYVARGVSPHMPEELRNAVAEAANGNVEELDLNDTMCVSGFTLKVVWPQKAVDGKENEDSLELVLSYSKGNKYLSGLLTGDAEKVETGRIIELGKVGDVDFLKVGHHGSAVSITQEQARRLDPEISVASAGEGNAYGHPNKECVTALEDAGSLFLCTKDTGDVEICPGDAGPNIRTQRVSGF